MEAGGAMSAGEKRRAGTGDFERQVEEIRREAALVRENLAAAERALAEVGSVCAVQRGTAQMPPAQQPPPQQQLLHQQPSAADAAQQAPPPAG